MLHLYLGEDDYRLREAYRALCRSLDGGDGMLSANTTLLEGRGLRPAELVQRASTVPFLAAARVVVVEGLLAAAGGGQAAVRAWQPLLDALPALPPTNHVVLLDPIAGREQRTAIGRSPLLRALRGVDGADVREFRPLSLSGRGGNEVAGWLREQARARGVAIDPRAVDALVELVGADLWMLSAEIDKLGRYAEGRAVTEQDVRLLTPAAREQSIFELVDAVVEGHAARALLLARRMADEGPETPGGVQRMVARQLRHLVRAAELLERGAEQAAIAEATGVTHEYALGKLVRQARTTARPAAEAALRAVEASDYAVKSGRLDEAVALDLLLVELAAIVRPAVAAPR